MSTVVELNARRRLTRVPPLHQQMPEAWAAGAALAEEPCEPSQGEPLPMTLAEAADEVTTRLGDGDVDYIVRVRITDGTGEDCALEMEESPPDSERVGTWITFLAGAIAAYLLF